MGYGDQQVKDLQETINRAECDAVVSGTPIDLNRVLKANKPLVRVRYDLKVREGESLESLLSKF
ncbi:MAG: hypothetical protein AB7S97_06455 [Thermoplasmata archaeon]